MLSNWNNYIIMPELKHFINNFITNYNAKNYIQKIFLTKLTFDNIVHTTNNWFGITNLVFFVVKNFDRV